MDFEKAILVFSFSIFASRLIHLDTFTTTTTITF